jgi:hypothetical protein
MKQIARQIRMEGFPPIAVVNRAPSAVLIFSAASQLDTIMPEH